MVLTLVAAVAAAPAGAAGKHVTAGSEPGSGNAVLQAPRSAVEEIEQRRTAHSTTWSTRDGSRITRVGLQPVRWRDAQGDWRAFDFDLKRDGDHLAPASWRVDKIPVDVELPSALGASGKDTWVLTAGNDRIAMALTGADAAAKVDGTQARYPDALPGVTVELGAVADGLKETLSLAGPSATSAFDYAIKVPEGLTVSKEARSGAVVVSRDDRAVFRLPAPIVTDASGRVAPRPAYTVKDFGDGRASISFSVDRGWLARGDRKWPVVVDPTTNVVSSTVPSTRMCPAGEYDVTTVCNDPNMAAAGYLVRGTNFGPQQVGLRFAPLTYLAADDYIDSAHLKMYQVSNVITGAATDQGVTASAINGDWTASRPYGYGTYPFFGQPSSPQLNPPLSAKGTAAPLAGAGWLDANITDVVSYWQRYRTRPAEGLPDYGVQLGRASTAAGTRIDTRIAPPGTANAPYLEIKSIAAAPSGAEVTSPGEGLSTARRVNLVAHSPNASVTSMTFQYVAGSQRYWTDIPASALRFDDGTSVSSTNIPVIAASGGGVDNKKVVWDLQATTGGNIDGSIHVRAVLTGPAGANGATEPVNFKLNRRDQEKQATAPIGPGQVNLVTGDFSVSSEDVNVKSLGGGLAVSRSYHSRNVSTRDAEMFGPNWAASFAGDGGAMPYASLYNYSEVKEEQVTRWVTAPGTYVDEADFDAGEEAAGTDPAAFSNALPLWTPVTDTVRWTYSYAEVHLSNGSRITFTQVTDPNGQVTGWEPDADHAGMKLTGSTGNPWVLTEVSGATTTFASDGAGSPNYHVTTFTQPGSNATPTMEYQTVGGRYRLTKVTAGKFSVNAPEDRYLRFLWTQDASTGNQPRVTSIVQGFWSGSAMTERPVQTYAYDSQGRLLRAVNPRLSTTAGTTIYTYDAGGHVDTIAPPGQVAWRLAYTTVTGDDNTGRLASVKRAHPTLGTDATWTVRYDVPLTGTNAPTLMTKARLATWDQTDDLPTDATTISVPSSVPSSPTQWTYGSTVYYMDANGREVNRLRGVGEAATLSTTQYDDDGNAVMELTGANRNRALASTTVPTQQAAQALETVRHYAADGVDELWKLGPTHKMTVPGVGEVWGRTRTVTSYDANSPGGAAYHLPTTVAVSAQYDDSSGTHYADTRTTTYAYDGVDKAGFPNRGWSLRMPTSVTVDPGGTAAPMTTRTVYHNSLPLVMEVQAPAATGGFGGAHRTNYQYYGINDFPARSEWTGQLLKKFTTVNSPEAPMPTVTINGYDFDLNPTSRTTAGAAGATRTETLGYDAAGRPTTRAVQMVASGVTTTAPTVTMAYDNQGHVTTVSSTAGPLTSAFDNNGRLISYTDSKASVTAYTYNINGDLSLKTDPRGTQTYGYNARQLPTTINDSVFGVVSGTYDEDDNLKTQSVLGVVTTNTWDPANELSDRVHLKTSCSCVWAEDHDKYDAGGRVVAETTGTGKRSLTMTYDGASRLKVVQDKATLTPDECVTRVYGYDVDSNRTSRTNYVNTNPNVCQSTTNGFTKTSVYDSADRLVSSGQDVPTYDGLQRITAIPFVLPSIAFDVNDQMVSLQQGSFVFKTFGQDPISRPSFTSPGTPTPNPTTSHYDSAESGVSWTETDGTDGRPIATRYLKGLDEQLIARKASDQTASTIMLSNIHGDVVAEGLSTGSATNWTGTYDEFGAPLGGGATRDYGWLGAHGVVTGGYPGVMQMGARTYFAPIGRFLQPDPVHGGSANAYDYANQDPFNQIDLDGREPGSAISMAEARKYYKKYYKCVELWGNNGIGYTKCFRHRAGLKGCLKELTKAPDTDEINKPGGFFKFFVGLAPEILASEVVCFIGARKIKE
jgi:RHS repeat-associated protein